ncbi:MAG: hypothetical protein AAGF53_02015 [Pseudomonadota bacterium]
MRVVVSLLLVAMMGLSACSTIRESRVNPFNWGVGAKTTNADDTRAVPISPSDRQTGNPLINDDEADLIVRRNVTSVGRTGIFRRRNRQFVYPGTLVDQVTDVVLEPVPSGVIVRVKGLPIRQGAFDVRLLRANEDGPVDGVLEYSLNAVQPTDNPQGSQRIRQIEVAEFVSNEDLRDVEQLRIVARRNSRTLKP